MSLRQRGMASIASTERYRFGFFELQQDQRFALLAWREGYAMEPKEAVRYALND